MASTGARGGKRVVVITGGGGGIGAGIAEELGRQGAFVVTMDPLVTLDGAAQLPPSGETTAGRIVAAGGTAHASSVSGTDRDGVRALFTELVDEHGRLDAVINVAGISRPTGFGKGAEDDWRSVLSVHLDGYLNVLDAALPIMAAAGHGRILGVTSGSGWRPADAGAYSCAKRAVAALTWQLGAEPPPGVVVNAISPIAVTRMVTAALAQARGAAGGGGEATRSVTPASGGLSLGAMPNPEDLGPLGAYLVSDGIDWCSGRVIFAGGSEIAVVDEPHLLEVVRADAASLAHVLDATAAAFERAEAGQATTGGGNPRFPGVFDTPTGELPPAAVETCAVVSNRPDLAAAVTAALEARKVTCTSVAPPPAPAFASAAGAWAAAGSTFDAVVVAAAGAARAAQTSGWERILAEHAGIVDDIQADAAWTRAVAEQAASTGRPIRLVTLTDAVTAGGRSRAQAAAQLARAARGATDDRVAAFAVGVETGGDLRHVGALAAHLVSSPQSAALAGAELVAGDGWFGMRSHPRPRASLTFGGPALPEWFDRALRQLVGAHDEEAR